MILFFKDVRDLLKSRSVEVVLAESVYLNYISQNDCDLFVSNFVFKKIK